MEDLPTIFERALELGGVERDRYLSEACKGDANKRREIEQMIASAARADAFFEDVTEADDNVTAQARVASPLEGPGTIIGA